MMPPPHTPKPGFVRKDPLSSVAEVYVQGYPATQRLMGSPSMLLRAQFYDPRIFISLPSLPTPILPTLPHMKHWKV